MVELTIIKSYIVSNLFKIFVLLKTSKEENFFVDYNLINLIGNFLLFLNFSAGVATDYKRHWLIKDNA